MKKKSSIQFHTGPKGVTFLTFGNKDERAEVLLMMSRGNILFFDTETTGLRVRSGEHQCRMVGLQFGDPKLNRTSEVFCIPWDEEMKALFPKLVEAACRVVAHGLRFDSHATGYRLPIKRDRDCKFLDTQMLIYFQDTSARKGLDELASSFGYPDKIPTPALIKNGRIDEMDQIEAFEYLADDVKCTSVIYYQVIEWGVHSWLVNVDLPLEGVVQRMEARGVRVLPDKLAYAEKVATEEADKLREKMVPIGGDINYGSYPQLGELFKNKGWKTGTTDTGAPSTNTEILEEHIRNGNMFCADLLAWRKMTKLRSSFFRPLQAMHKSSPTGFVHPSFNTMGPKTGRFSCSDPNFQQAANARGDTSNLAWYVRGSITHDDGVSAGDYSQVELRVVAALSQEPALLDAFARGLDIHKATAAKMFKVPFEQVTTEMRFRAKAVNFGLLFGMTEFGLSRELLCSVEEARTFLYRHQDGLPVLTQWLQDERQTYEKTGKAFTHAGRTIRYLEWQKTSPGLSVRVQGTAAEIIRAALIGIEEAGLEPVLQVHDEVVCKGRGKGEEIGRIMQYCAEKAFPDLASLVQFPCDVGDGDHWAEAH